jgi:hypothetical protein
MPVAKRTQLLTGHTNKRDNVVGETVYTIVVDGTGGTFDLEVDGDLVDNAAYNITAADLRTAIIAASDEVQEVQDDVTVTGGPGNAGGTTPYVLTIPDIDGHDDPLVVTSPADALTGGAGTVTITQTGGLSVATHHTDVITDPESNDAVQTPIAQQTGGLDSQHDQTPAEALNL